MTATTPVQSSNMNIKSNISKSKADNTKIISSSFFYNYGRICAMYPCEVIFAVITMATCFITIDRQQHNEFSKKVPCKRCLHHEVEYNAASVIVMTIVRCVAILYSYYQLRNLCRLNSKYILIISGAFTMFSSFVFTTTLINYLHTDVADLKDAIFFFLLLVDLSKTSQLAQFALSSNNHQDIKENIARGMSILGPTITLDVIVETLLLSVGTLSGVQRLEVLSYFACLSIIVNYVVFMTFYPACLCFILELSRYGTNREQTGHCMLGAFNTNDEDHKVNPVVQRVKVIMSFGLFIVHLHSRYVSSSTTTLQDDLNNNNFNQNFNADKIINTNIVTDLTPTLNEYVLKWITLSLEHIVVLIIIMSLTVKFVFFKDQTSELNENDINVRLVERETINFQDEINEIKITNDVLLDEVLNFEEIRDLDICISIYKSEKSAKCLTDTEILLLVNEKVIPAHQLEKIVEDPLRGVKLRRKLISQNALKDVCPDLTELPVDSYDYNKVLGTCCENVLGYVPVPLGVVGPLKLDGKEFHVPLATTEGCLVASTNRGCRALSLNGVTSRVVADGMTRGPVVRFTSLSDASEAMNWLQTPANFALIKDEFDSTSNFARLTKIQVKIAGRYLFIRFVAKTGDAMGMNMLSKATEHVLKYLLQTQFHEMEILSVSGNFCADKKAAAINWLEGRGKSVVCDAVVPGNIVKSVLKTSVHALVDVNISKNLVGSAVAGCTSGGYNAHAANIVTAIFIATGQDPAQNVSSSSCLTLMEPCGDDDLYISCTMPSLEVGTVGGGTALPAQRCCLKMLGVSGPHADTPGSNAEQLARVICATVLAGELSLMSALAAGHLVQSHLRYNRK